MTTTAQDRHRLEALGPLALVGAGKMGGALLDGWLGLGLDPRKLTVLDPEPSEAVRALASKGVNLNPRKAADDDFAAIVLAIKPQTAPDALPTVKSLLAPGTVVISIMAGRTLAFLEQNLGNAAIVRAMPNTPAAIGRGITVAVANARVNAAQRALAHALLVATGRVEWVGDERLIDAVTAVSGSGPAYVFLLTEALAKAGAAAGLPNELAATLARETVAGSGELLHRSPLAAEILRQNVTSPGGTTAAALDILMGRDGLEALMTEAVAAATKRSRDLAG
ncbi:MAG: pyrroline-5-carboxylate reductase [Rhizobiales bacterium]|nr:pyrroline-5-carboxylate reductase [Hyphomicrobiales bacterium]